MAKEKKDSGYFVTSEFRDRDNYDHAYKVGDDVSHFDKDRLNLLVENGYAEYVEPKAPAKGNEETSKGNKAPAKGNETEQVPEIPKVEAPKEQSNPQA